jgi:hypothetical protein
MIVGWLGVRSRRILNLQELQRQEVGQGETCTLDPHK